MKILLEKNEKLKTIQESIMGNKNIEISIDDVFDNSIDKSQYELLIIYCNSIEDIIRFKKIKTDNKLLVITENSRASFLYSLICTLHPLDVIYGKISTHAMNVRITSNMDLLRGEKE